MVIDDLIHACIGQGTAAVLNLGAGLDTRPYRLALPESLHWIEVDYAHVLEFKQARLATEQPRCRLERIALDLSDRDARRQLFEQMGSRFRDVLVLTEGVMMYLAPEEAGELADDLAAVPALRRWIVDYLSPLLLRRRRNTPIQRHMRNAPFRFVPRDYFGFFQQHGWKALQIRYLWDEGVRLGRPMPLPRIAILAALLRGLFLSRARREAERRFTGYVLFESASR
jgi:methyltransferase (TIGR00027 family)